MAAGSSLSATRRIFLSYGHDEHRSLAERLKRDLEARGHEVWFDVDRLKPGADWEASIDEGLAWAAEDPARGRVVLLMTPHSVRRPDGYCLNEVARAVSRRLIVVPVMVVWCEPPLSICRIQWLDMQDCVPIAEQEARYDAKFPLLAEGLEQDRLEVEGAQSTLLRLLRPLPFEAEIADHVPRFTGRQWVFEEIDRWLARKGGPKVFWITGGPGVGKTAIAAWLCHNRPEVAAFHLCRHGHDLKSNPRSAVLSIAYQLSSQLPEYASRLAASDLGPTLSEADAATLFDVLIVQLARGFPPPDRTLVILIDALDEASRGGRNELASFLASEFSKTPDWLRLLITSRPDPEVRYPLQGLTPYVLDAERPENMEDIRAYLRRELRRHAPSGSVARETVDIIAERSGGVFLYVEWIRRELEEGRLSLAHVEEFPQGLGGVYARFFERQFPDRTAYEADVAPALDVLAAAREPLEPGLLARIFDWDERRQMKFYHSLGSLFLIVDRSLQPFHQSVMDWLTDSDRSGPYFASENTGHQRLAELGWKEYLSDGPNGMSSYSLAHLPLHLTLAKRWEDLEALLTDLRFVEARATAGLTFELVSDYEHALSQWPGREDTPATTGSNLLAEMRSTETLAARDASQAVRSSRLERVDAFSTFTSQHSHVLASSPGETLSLARNYASGGPVAESAEPLVEARGRPWVAREPRLPRPPVRPACQRNLQGHSGPVTSVALSTDGRTAVSASQDQTLRVWDIASGACRRKLAHNTSPFTSVALTRDGRTIVSGGEDKLLRVWDIRTATSLMELTGHEEKLSGVALTPDETHAVSSSWDGSLRVWDLVKGKCVLKLAGHDDKVLAVAVASDGRIAVSAGADGTVRVWELESGGCAAVFRGHTFWVSDVTLAPDGRVAVSAGWDETMRVWDVASGKCLRVIEVSEGCVNAVALAGGGTVLYSGGADGSVAVWDVSSGERVRSFKEHVSSVNRIATREDGRIVASASDDHTLRIWDPAVGVSAGIFERHSGRVLGMALTPDGSTVVSAGVDHTVRVWDFPSGRSRFKIEGHSKLVFGTIVTPDGRAVVSASSPTSSEASSPAAARTSLRLWSIDSGRMLANFRGHRSSVEAVALTPDGQTMLSASWDKTLRLWELGTGRCLRVLRGKGDDRSIQYTGYLRDAWKREPWEGPSEPVTAVTLSPDGRRAISETVDKHVTLWDLASGRPLWSFGGRPGIRRLEKPLVRRPGVVVTSDGCVALSVDWERNLRVWYIRRRRRRWCLEAVSKRVEGLVLTPQGRWALSTGYDRVLHVWDILSGKCLRTLLAHADDVNDVRITPDGRSALSASSDHAVRVWDLATGELLTTHHTGAPVVALSPATPDGRFTCGTADGQVQFLELRSREQAAPIATVVRLFRLLPELGRVTSSPALNAPVYSEGEVIPWTALLPARRRERDAPLYAERELIPGRFYEDLTACCGWCGRRFAPRAEMLETITAIGREAGLSPESSPCLELSEAAWNEVRLLSQCPHCDRPFRLNPFVVDARANLDVVYP